MSTASLCAAAAAPELKPDIAMTRAFLDLLAEGDPVTFQAFDDSTRKDGRLAVHFTAELEDVASLLSDLNGRGAGIFWMVNRGDGGGRSTANVTGVRALFVDLDGAPVGPVESCSVEPHAIVESSRGRWHAYWLVEGVTLYTFKPAQLALAKKFGGDTSVHDLPRVMRLPGFVHRKGEPVRTELRATSAHQPYQFADFVSRLGLDLTERTRPSPTAVAGSVAGAIPPGGRHKYLEGLFGTLNRRGVAVDTIAAALQAENAARCVPPLDAADVGRMVSSMIKRYKAQHGEADSLPPQIDIAAAMAASALREAAGGLVARSGECGTKGASDAGEGASGAEDDELSGLSHAPVFDYAMAPGILGQFIKSETEFSEAPPIGVLANLVTRLSADIGRSCFIPAGRNKLNLRVNWLCAGPTALGRKGTAAEIAECVRQAAFARQEGTLIEPASMRPARTETSLSTGEGLIQMLRTTPREQDAEHFKPPGLLDNRLMIDAQEFSGVLKKASGKEATLSERLREAYDGATLSNTSASNAMQAKRPHVVVSASVPGSELVKLLSGDSAVEASNGLLNRFVITHQLRSKIVASPAPGGQWTFEQMADAYRGALMTAWGATGGYRVEADNSVELTMTNEARSCYKAWYLESQARVGAAYVQALLARESNVLKCYAATLALLRSSLCTEVEDIEAAKKLLDYWRGSLEFIFTQGQQTAEAKQLEAESIKLLAAMLVGRPASMYDLRHTKPQRRAVLIDWMQRQSPPWVSIHRTRAAGGGKEKTEVIRLL